MTLKVIIMNGQLRLTTPTVECAGVAFTTLFPLATSVQLASGATTFRLEPKASIPQGVGLYVNM